MNPRKLMLALAALLSLGLAVPTVAIAQTGDGGRSGAGCDNVLSDGFDEDDEDNDDDGGLGELLENLLGGDDDEDDNDDGARNSEGRCLDGSFDRNRSGFDEEDGDDDDDGGLGELLENLLGGDDDDDDDGARNSQGNGSNGSNRSS
ncbi:MAG: DUF834 domain-containing protein [Actinomycetota bacterium]|nr:DUF834 domain-containing protein [Actinomycetota bacterium]